MDLKEIILEAKAIKNDFKSKKYDASKLADDLLFISEPIMNNKANSQSNIQQYTAITSNAVEKLKNGVKLSQDEFDQWTTGFYQLLSLIYINMSLNDNIDNTSDDELDELLFNDLYFDDQLGNITRFFASFNFAKKDPMRCYNSVMSTFEKRPDLITSFLANRKYVYDRKKINDKINKTCPICGSRESTPFYCVNQSSCDDSNFSPAKVWMKCESCTNLYAYNFPIFKAGEINGHYSRKAENKTISPRFSLKCYSNIFNTAKRFHDGNEYLEVGIGNGEMLACALEMGYNVSAVEICKSDCEYISGALDVDIVWSDFLKYDTEKRFDLIIMGDVLEHVSEPIAALEKAYSLLNEKGILWLSTPNYNSAFTRMRKFTDPMWNQKNHFTYFSREGILPFLEKIGFELRQYDISDRYNGSMELYLQKK